MKNDFNVVDFLFEITNGNTASTAMSKQKYETLIDKHQSSNLDFLKSFCPLDAKNEVFIFIGENGQVWPYRGIASLSKGKLVLSEPCYPFSYDCFLQSALFDIEADENLIKAYKKFYTIDWIAIEVDETKINQDEMILGTKTIILNGDGTFFDFILAIRDFNNVINAERMVVRLIKNKE